MACMLSILFIFQYICIIKLLTATDRSYDFCRYRCHKKFIIPYTSSKVINRLMRQTLTKCWKWQKYREVHEVHNTAVFFGLNQIYCNITTLRYVRCRRLRQRHLLVGVRPQVNWREDDLHSFGLLARFSLRMREMPDPWPDLHVATNFRPHTCVKRTR